MRDKNRPKFNKKTNPRTKKKPREIVGQRDIKGEIERPRSTEHNPV